MIVTCPQCQTKFNVPDNIMGEDGKMMRCSVCAHSWHFYPPQDENAPPPPEQEDEDEDDFTIRQDILDGQNDIPDAIKPRDGEHETAQNPKDKKLILMISGAATFILFLFSFLILMILKGPLTAAHPAFHAFYGFFGMQPEILKTDIIFSHPKVTMKEDNLHITGQLMNMGEKEEPIPMIRAVFLDDHEQPLKTILIAPPQENLAGGETITFAGDYPAPDEIAYVKIGFTMQDTIPATKEAEEGYHKQDDHMSGDKNHNTEEGAHTQGHDSGHSSEGNPEQSHAPEDPHSSHGAKSDAPDHH